MLNQVRILGLMWMGGGGGGGGPFFFNLGKILSFR